MNQYELLYMYQMGDCYAERCLLQMIEQAAKFQIKKVFHQGYRPYYDEVLCNILGEGFQAIQSYRLDIQCSLRTFCNRVLYFKALSVLRVLNNDRQKAHFEAMNFDVETDFEEAFEYFEQKESLDCPSYYAQFQFACDRYHQFVQALPKLDQKILELYMSSKSYQEASDQLGISMKEYRNKVQNIRKQVKSTIIN